MHLMYKIVDLKAGKPCTLFHGLNGSKILPRDTWLVANKKLVTDGSRQFPYMSGFHVMPDVQSCYDYLTRFKNVKDKAIVACYALGIRSKPQASGPVFLADKIKILHEVFDKLYEV